MCAAGSPQPVGALIDAESLPEWARKRPRTRALICDIDDTICSQFEIPIAIALRFLTALDRSIQVHYVTARPIESRDGTERFMAEHRLPGWRNLHFCPNHKSTRGHKTEVMTRLAKEYHVLVSIGDAEEDELASLTAGVPFVRVRDNYHESVWEEVERIVRVALGENEVD